MEEPTSIEQLRVAAPALVAGAGALAVEAILNATNIIAPNALNLMSEVAGTASGTVVLLVASAVRWQSRNRNPIS